MKTKQKTKRTHEKHDSDEVDVGLFLFGYQEYHLNVTMGGVDIYYREAGEMTKRQRHAYLYPFIYMEPT